jgi:hypothetical protein
VEDALSALRVHALLEAVAAAGHSTLPTASACSTPKSLTMNGRTLQGPDAPADAGGVWRQTMDSWRNACLVEINPDQLEWTRTAYFQPLMMPFDRFFYNETRGVYTVDRWLDFLEEEHGGIDSVLLWPTYTNIGADDRNQFELVESLPVEYW